MSQPPWAPQGKLLCEAGTRLRHSQTQTYRHINKNEIYCWLCNENEIENEFCFILECKSIVDLRKKYIPNYYYINRPKCSRFNQLMSSDKITVLLNVTKFTNEGFIFLSKVFLLMIKWFNLAHVAF